MSLLDKTLVGELEKKLNYKFADLEFLETAFTHPSAETDD